MSHHILIVNAVTEYDVKQSKKKGYNPYALAHYLKAAQNIDEYMAQGMQLRDAILKSYSGRLLDCVLRRCKLPVATLQEHRR